MKAIKSLVAVSVLAAAGSANATTWNLTMHANNYLASISGNLVMDFTGTWDDVTNTGAWHGNTHSENTTAILDLTYTQTFTMDETIGKGTLNALNQATCTDTNGGLACAGFGPSFNGKIFNNINFGGNAFNSSGSPFSPVDSGPFTWSFLPTIQTNEETEFTPLHMSVCFHVVDGPSCTPQAVTPVPAAAWLFGSGLIGLAGTVRRKAKNQ